MRLPDFIELDGVPNSCDCLYKRASTLISYMSEEAFIRSTLIWLDSLSIVDFYCAFLVVAAASRFPMPRLEEPRAFDP